MFIFLFFFCYYFPLRLDKIFLKDMNPTFDKSEDTFTLNNNNYITVSKYGGRILKLVLNGVIVIQASEPLQQLGTGSYLMYPWVNRLQKPHPIHKPVFFDGNGLPLHGLVVNAEHTFLKSLNAEQTSLLVVSSPATLTEGLAGYQLTYQLRENSLSVTLVVDQGAQPPFCFGFHPFLQINEQKIKDLTIESNIITNLKLDQNLLPVYPFSKQQITISSQNTYDSLFLNQQSGYFRLYSPKTERQVEIRSDDMHFWQVYTPPDGSRIAVEPMTFCGNLYSVYNQATFGKLPTKAGFQITVK